MILKSIGKIFSVNMRKQFCDTNLAIFNQMLNDNRHIKLLSLCLARGEVLGIS